MLILIPSKSIVNPKSVRGLNVWYDATTGLFDSTSGGSPVTSNGASIARWEDQSGNGWHLTQSTGSARPTLLTGALNSNNGVDFNGSSQYIFDQTTSSCQLTSNMLFVFFVFKFDTYVPTATVYPMQKGGGYASNVSGQWNIRRWDKSPFSGSPGTFETQINTNGLWEFGPAGFSSTSYQYAVFTFPRTTVRNFSGQLIINDVVNTTRTNMSDNGSPGSATLHKFSLGAGLSGTPYSPNFYFDGVICEVAIYLRNFDFTQNEYQGLSRYFRKKWGI